MLAVLYGLGAASAYGTGDFLAGFASRRAPTIVVVLVAKVVGGAMLLVFSAATGDQLNNTAIAWGAAAGVALGLGSLAFYRGLAVGSMGVVAAVMGVGQALVPFVAGVAFGERLSNLALSGAIVGIVAVVLLVAGSAGKAEVPGASRQPSGLAEGALAGLLFGLFFILLDRADAGGPLFPSASAMFSGAVTVLLPALATRQKLVPSRAAMPAIVGVGVCSGLGTLAFVLGVREGHLSVVAVVEGLSPAVTALCAFFLAEERLSQRKRVGLAVALAGILMMAAG